MVTLFNYCKENNKEYLLEEWDYENNIGLSPNTVTSGSNRKIWWKCSYCGHNWQTTINKRTINGSGCPKCRHSKRLKFCKNDNLLVTHPEIAQDWHSTKNGKLTPEMFTKDSKYKVWWKCNSCGKEIEKEIRNYNGCLDCKNQTILNERNLTITHPKIAKDWHPTKNGQLKPNNVTAGSNKFVWWKCQVCGYEWRTKISNRASSGRACPCCSNKIVVSGKNDLTTTHPEIAKQWHPTKNGDLTPQKVSSGSNKKVWWICPKGHEYQATVGHRTPTNGTNCPICSSGSQTSFAEQAIYYYVKQLYPDAISRYTADFLGKMELDIYIPSIKMAIEYDGLAWHKKEKINREKLKYQRCKEQGIKLIRFREKFSDPFSEIADEQLGGMQDLYKAENLEYVIIEFLKMINYSEYWLIKCPVDVNIERDRQKILQYKTVLKNSFQDEYPEIAKEWHPTKNGNLKPNMFKPHSSHKVWWLCPNCGNEYEATISHRTDNKNPVICHKCAVERRTQLKRKAVNMIDANTNQVIKTFISISEAQRQTNIRNISMVCNGVRPIAGGYKWAYADDNQ